MDRAEEIIQELVRICETLGPAVELDRRYRVDDEDAPLIVVRTGEEELAPPESASSKSAAWDRRWIMRPVIEVYTHDHDDAAQRAELTRIWLAFLAEFKASKIPAQIIPRGYLPELKRDLLGPDEYAAIGGMSIELGIVFDR